MNFIYDILLNLNKQVIDFYDWNEEDKVVHIKKAPLFKVNSDFIKNLTNNCLKVSPTFLQEIFNKTEIYSKKSIRNISYLAIFSDGQQAIAVKFDKQGISKQKSKFLIDEDIEINYLANHLKTYTINYKVIRFYNSEQNMTRFQKKCYFFIIDNIKNLEDTKKIKYLNYELFSDKSESKQVLINNVKKNIQEQYLKMYNFFKLMSSLK